MSSAWLLFMRRVRYMKIAPPIKTMKTKMATIPTINLIAPPMKPISLFLVWIRGEASRFYSNELVIRIAKDVFKTRYLWKAGRGVKSLCGGKIDVNAPFSPGRKTGFR